MNLLRKFKEHNNFAVEMISDRSAKIAKAYDVYWFTKGFGDMKLKQAVPSKFLIDKNGTVVWKYVGVDTTDRTTVKKMMILIDKYLRKPN